ncbi:hypothetical protein A9Q91_02565 [Candidatus Gracilibacteria bacterium 28_42_T64]|nr:hypothetical protein A9Q91_02565 [Candidatus Gracilibacteria bacterium 28_42_T64]
MTPPEIRDIYYTQVILAVRHSGEKLSNGETINEVTLPWVNKYSIRFREILELDGEKDEGIKGNGEKLDLSKIEDLEIIEKILYGTNKRRTIHDIMDTKTLRNN